jgi:NhaA family Na+:H+ antiporter
MASKRSHHKNMFDHFLHSQIAGSAVLVLATVIALVWANSSLAPTYFALSDTYLGISFGESQFKMSLSHWIKDGLMTIFFFVVGLEIKREIVVGELSSIEKAMMPVCAAIGGAIVPAAIYIFFNMNGEGAAGWGIPMATDIAFALGVLSLFGSRVPIGLKVFLTALAIADDLLAVAVIAVFYTPEIHALNLVFAGAMILLMMLLNKMGVRATWVYTLIAVMVWFSVLGSGVHATVAGVLIAMAIPVRPNKNPEQLVSKATKLLQNTRADDMSLEALIHDDRRRNNLSCLTMLIREATPPAHSMEHALQPFQSFIILPLFALFSAGVALDASSLEGFPTDISMGVIAGLVVGKPIGVLLSSWLVMKITKTHIQGVSIAQLIGAGFLAGIGFTMSIFVSELAFTDPVIVAQAKIGILIASITAGVLGAIMLHYSLPKGDANSSGPNGV